MYTLEDRFCYTLARRTALTSTLAFICPTETRESARARERESLRVGEPMEGVPYKLPPCSWKFSRPQREKDEKMRSHLSLSSLTSLSLSLLSLSRSLGQAKSRHGQNMYREGVAPAAILAIDPAMRRFPEGAVRVAARSLTIKRHHSCSIARTRTHHTKLMRYAWNDQTRPALRDYVMSPAVTETIHSVLLLNTICPCHR